MSEVHPSATVVLIRDAYAGLEVLLLERSQQLEFGAGNWVFPGGKIDPQDFADDPGNLESAARLAAIREAREETGIDIAGLPLLYFSHWVTPAHFSRRFATWFFIAELPTADQAITVDGSEIVSSRWCSPQQALEQYENKTITMMPPTYVTLMQLAASNTAAEALAACRDLAVQNFLPKVVPDVQPTVMLYEGDAGYQTLDCQQPGPRHRLILGKEGYEYQRDL